MWRIRHIWSVTLENLGGGAAELGGGPGPELLQVTSHCKPLPSKVHLPLLREKLTELGMVGESWADQFTTGCQMLGAALEEDYPM